MEAVDFTSHQHNLSPDARDVIRAYQCGTCGFFVICETLLQGNMLTKSWASCRLPKTSAVAILIVLLSSKRRVLLYLEEAESTSVPPIFRDFWSTRSVRKWLPFYLLHEKIPAYPLTLELLCWGSARIFVLCFCERFLSCLRVSVANLSWKNT